MPLWIRWLWATLGVLVLLALAVNVIGNILLMVALALMLATGMWPIVRFLEGRGIAHGLAVPMTFLSVALAVSAAVAVVVPPLFQQASALILALPGYAGNLRWLGTQWVALTDRFAFLPSLAEITAWLTVRAGAYLQGLLSLTTQAVTTALGAFSIAFLLYYFLRDGRTLAEQLLQLVPPFRREETRALLGQLADRVGRFLLGTATDMTIVGALTGLGLWLIGVPNALALGVIVGTFNILPYVGATLGSLPGLIVAFSISPRTGFLALAVYLVVQQLEGYVIYPRVVGNAVGLHPVYVLLALSIGTQVWGVVGVFIGIPAAVVFKTVLEVWVIPWVQRITPPPTATAETSPHASALPAVTFMASEDTPARGVNDGGRQA
jgi:predicted PurR-regulated permease PerM